MRYSSEYIFRQSSSLGAGTGCWACREGSKACRKVSSCCSLPPCSQPHLQAAAVRLVVLGARVWVLQGLQPAGGDMDQSMMR